MTKEPIYQPYLSLPQVQLKYLCFMAYTGNLICRKVIEIYQKVENLSSDELKTIKEPLRKYSSNSYYLREVFDIDIVHLSPLMLYMIEVNPSLIELFDKNYKRYRHLVSASLLHEIKCCIDGKPFVCDFGSRPLSYDFPILAPLAYDPRFIPMMMDVYQKDQFVMYLLVDQLENDICDPDNTVSQIAALYYKRMSTADTREVKSAIALYDYFKWGKFDEKIANEKGIYAYLLAGARALYEGDYAQAFKNMVLSIREFNKLQIYNTRGHFSRIINNYLLVMTYHLHKADEDRKLSALLKKNGFIESNRFAPVVWLAQYFSTGQIPSTTTIEGHLKGDRYHTPTRLEMYFALLVARFMHIDVECPDDLSKVPNSLILRHELSPWLPISDDERGKMSDLFGGVPLLPRIKFKQQWEILLEELTPEGKNTQHKEVRRSRIAYVINPYGYVELREQVTLKTGGWSVGKNVSLYRFRQGMDIMDDTDREIAKKIEPWQYNLELEDVLPFLVGSDRVFVGQYAPLSPVVIDQEKPFLMIDRTNKGFILKSNVKPKDLGNNTVYRKDSEMHYTVININERQRFYYQKLLSIDRFPLDAEQQLREFLPRVSDIVEVHSDLVEGGTTLEQRDGSPALCLRLVPSSGMVNSFSLWCLARPLPEGKNYFEPGGGMNPCVTEQDGVRYQVLRDIKGERANLLLLRTFLNDNNLLLNDADDRLVDGSPVRLYYTAVLMLIDFVRQHPDNFFLEWPDGGQLNLKTSQPSSWNISIRSKSGWFEVEGEIPIDDETVLSVGELLKLVTESPRPGFIRLNDSDFLAISERLQKQLARLESLTVTNRGHLQISEFHASLLGSALSGEIDIKHDKRIDQLQKKIEKSMALQPEVPPTLKAELRLYQIDGYQWMTRMTGWGAGVCLADDMGLGKTVQTIAFMLHTADRGAALVAAPASVVLNWRRELQRFAPSLHVEVLNEAENRKELVEIAAAGDVILTTYGLFVTEDEILCAKEWNTVCLDEAHVIKNRQTKTSAVVMKLSATNRIILTGTPVQNHLGELWNLFQFANPGLLGSHEQFRQKYIIPIEQQNNKERSQQLKRIVGPFMLRRTKQEVIEELPDKTEITIPVELGKEELAVYEVIRRRAKKMLEEESSSSGVSVNTLAEITRLRQAACSAQLVEKGWSGECSKLNALGDLLQEIVDGGNAVLVFSQFTSFLSLVRKRLDEQKTSYLYLDGSVPVKQRDKLVQQFQHGQCPVFLISLKAGGLGLNLTGANYVIHLDPWWNPAIEQQATDRAYRIGQQQNVTVYHLISQHTIEEKILRLHQTKRNLADAMLAGTNETHKLTSKDLLEMIDSGVER